MKKMLSVLMIIVMCFTIAPTTASAAIKINKSSAAMYIGDTLKLNISDTTEFVMWKSNNKTVATVNSKGIVKGKKEGKATITATVGIGSDNQKFTCKITVANRIKASSTIINCPLDEYQFVSFSVKKLKKDESLAYISGNEDIVTGKWKNDEDAMYITPVRIGSATMTVFIVKGEGLDESFDIDSGITIKVFVFRDSSGWISEKDLDKFDIDVSSYEDEIVLSKSTDSLWGRTESYHIKNLPDEIQDGVIYESDSIKYKYNEKKQQYYFNIIDLEALGILN